MKRKKTNQPAANHIGASCLESICLKIGWILPARTPSSDQFRDFCFTGPKSASKLLSPEAYFLSSPLSHNVLLSQARVQSLINHTPDYTAIKRWKCGRAETRGWASTSSAKWRTASRSRCCHDCNVCGVGPLFDFDVWLGSRAQQLLSPRAFGGWYQRPRFV